MIKTAKQTLLPFMMAMFMMVSIVSVANAAPEKYTFDPSHTSVLWHANHFGFSNPMGRFGIKSGTLVLDEAKPNDSKLDVTMDIASLTTGIDKFNEHLSSPDFLDVKKFPTATFKSTKVEVISKDVAKVTGDLTLHGVTKSVVLDVKLNKIGEHPMTKTKAAGFSAVATIKRSDFGISAYVPNVSDEVKLEIEAEAGLDKVAAK